MGNYPSSLDSFPTPTDSDKFDFSARIKGLEASVVELEKKVGIKGSTPKGSGVIRSNKVGSSEWAKLDLTKDVTGILPSQNGGTEQIAPFKREVIYQTSFETAARFTSSVYGTGAVAYAVSGQDQTTTTSPGAHMSYFDLNPSTSMAPFIGNFAMFASVALWSFTDGEVAWGLGNFTTASGGMTYGAAHACFKFIQSGSDIQLHAQQRNTATITKHLVDVTTQKSVEMCMVGNSYSGKIKYYYNLSGAGWSPGLELDTEFPVTAKKDIRFATTNNSLGNAQQVYWTSAGYRR